MIKIHKFNIPGEFKAVVIMKQNLLLILISTLFCTNLLAAPFWDNAKIKCKGDGKAVVKAKLKGAKFGKIKKTCKNNPPAFSALGATGEPSRCKRKVTGTVWGEWDLTNVARCNKSSGSNASTLYWDKAIHKCVGVGIGRVKARIRGTKLGKRKKTCEDTTLTEVSLGASGKPDYCKTQLTGSMYGYWEIQDDLRCLPKWGKLKKKGCMSPDFENGRTQQRQVYRAKLKKLKRHIEQTKMEWEDGKWMPFFESKKYKREQCMETMGPGENANAPGWGSPDFCKIKSGIWAYWYQEGEQCEKPLEWARIKDKGCVKDMETPDVEVTQEINALSKRSYHARLKNAGGNWVQACLPTPLATTKKGKDLNFQFPTGCPLKNADSIVGTAIGAGITIATTVGGAVIGTAAAPGVGSVAGAAAGAALGSVASSAATGFIVSKMDTSTSVQGVFWVDDASCGPVEQYQPVDNTGKVLLATGEISSNVANNANAPSESKNIYASSQLAWGVWKSTGCSSLGRLWSATINNHPAGMDWKQACRAAIQLPYSLGNYPQGLTQRLNSADPDIGYPDSCLLDQSNNVRGQFIIGDSSCN